MADELNSQEAGEDTYQEEVERALSKDETVLGGVWRGDQKKLDANEIAEELDAETTGFVYSYRRYIKAIVDVEGIAPRSPSMARQCASALRGFAKRHRESFSDATRLELQERADRCDLSAADPVKREEEEQKLEHQTSAAEKEEISGIYVYALPHYLRYPVEVSEKDETDDRTYLKVGMSERDPIKRFRQQRGSTALPEPPILSSSTRPPDSSASRLTLHLQPTTRPTIRTY